MRTKQERRLRADLDRLAQRITRPKLVKPDNINQAIGRLKERYPRVARYFHLAYATVDALRQAGVRLALLTNGAAGMQRDKIVRFELGHRFDHIQIEGEFGQGKPEPAVYRHALQRLGVEASDAWMVGDNYEWEVVAPQRLGMRGVWYDPFEAGVPAHATAQPARIIKRLAELVGS